MPQLLSRPLSRPLSWPLSRPLSGYNASGDNTVGTAWLTNGPFGTVRNDYDGWIGCEFTVGASDLRISALGRYCEGSGSQDHTVGIWDDTDTLVGSVVINGAQATDAFAYASTSPSFILMSGESYTVGSEEFNGGDSFRNIETGYTTTAAATLDIAKFGTPAGGSPNQDAAASSIYGPPDFKYIVLPDIEYLLDADGNQVLDADGNPIPTNR